MEKVLIDLEKNQVLVDVKDEDGYNMYYKMEKLDLKLVFGGTIVLLDVKNVSDKYQIEYYQNQYPQSTLISLKDLLKLVI